MMTIFPWPFRERNTWTQLMGSTALWLVVAVLVSLALSLLPGVLI
jgi:hypothetical protein